MNKMSFQSRSQITLNLPNWITLARLLGIPVILISLASEDPLGRIWAASAFGIAAGTDWLDGYLARRLDQVTELGKFLDPLADKLLVLAPLLMLIELGQVPAWGVFLLLARELAIAGWRVRQDQIQGANLWGKAKTVVQILAVLGLILQWPGALIGFWIAVGITLISGGIYLLPTAPSSEDP